MAGWWTEGLTSTSVTTEAGHLWWWQPAMATWTLYCVSSKRLFLILIIIQWLFVNIRCTLHIRVMYRPNVFLHVLWHLLSHKKAKEPVGDRVLFHVLPSVFRPPETFLIFLFVNEIKTYRRNFIDTKKFLFDLKCCLYILGWKLETIIVIAPFSFQILWKCINFCPIHEW